MKKYLYAVLVFLGITIFLGGGTYLIDAFYYWEFSPMSKEYRAAFMFYAFVGIIGASYVIGPLKK